MKKILFCAAMLAMGTTILMSCSKSEGVNAANDESVVGSTDGMEVVEESAGEFEDTDELPGNIIGEVSTTTEESAPDETATTDEGNKSFVDKAKDVYEKTKEGVEKGYEKTKEVGKEGVDKAKEGIEKAKDLGKEGVDKAKDIIEKVKK